MPRCKRQRGRAGLVGYGTGDLRLPESGALPPRSRRACLRMWRQTGCVASLFIREGNGLFDRNGFLAARLPADDTRLKRLLARALPTGGGQAVSGSMTVRRLPGLPRLTVHVNPVATRPMELDARRVAALVWVLDPEFRPHIDPGLVAATLGLTPVESRVAVLLAEGKSVHDIAAATGRQEHSVRFHIRQIHRKQGTSRRADLVRLALSLVDSSHSRP